MRLKGVYAVGVQHQRLVHVDEPPGQGVAFLAAAHAAADQHCVAAIDPCPDGVLRRQRQLTLLGRQGRGHGTVAFHRHDGPDILRHPQKHQSAAAADSGGSRQHRCAGVAHRAAQTVHLAEGALVPLWIAVGQNAFHVGAGNLHSGVLLCGNFSYYTTSVNRLTGNKTGKQWDFW